MSDEDDIFSRWSRRKRDVAREQDAAKAMPEVTPPMPVAVNDDEDEEALLQRLGLPLPESLTRGDDFSVFMRAGVPEFLRKRALRVLWRSNPVLANLDGLNDYDDDFTSPELTKKVLATAYKVGRGILRETLDPIPDQAAETVVVGEPVQEDTVVSKEVPPLSDPLGPSERPEVSHSDPDEIFRPSRMRFRVKT